jgi:hypothetical protein
METKFSKLNISDTKNCSYCNKPFTEELWCKECDPFRIIEGWTSGNPDIDKFIKDSMCKPEWYNINERVYGYTFLEWVTFDRFTDIKEVGEGGFAKVFSATWIDGISSFKQSDGSWKKREPKPKKIALKRLNGSQNMTEKYLNEVRFYIPNLIYFIFIV